MNNRRRGLTAAGESGPAHGTWEDLFRAIDAGTYATEYALGELIPLEVAGYGTVEMQIVAFDADELSDGSGYAPVTLVSKGPLGTTKQKWSTNATNAGGYPLCTLRTWMNGTIAPKVQAVIGSAHLAEVKKSSYGPANTTNPTTNDPRSTLWSDDLVWIISAREYGINTRENAGPKYNPPMPKSIGISYVLRSTFTTKMSTIDIILDNGNYGADYNYGTARSIRFGFCVK